MTQPANRRMVSEEALQTFLDDVVVPKINIPTFGDLFKPSYPTMSPSTEVTATVETGVGTWDGVGIFNPTSTPSIYDVGEFNGIAHVFPSYGVVVDPSGQDAAKILDYETILIGDFAIFGYFHTGGQQTIRVWVDDEELPPLSVTDAGLVYVTLQFAEKGTYKIRVAGLFFLGVFATNATQTFEKPTKRRALGVVSDSYYEQYAGGDSVPQRLQTATGWSIWNMAEGGTGYINPGAGGTFSKFGSAARLAALSTSLPYLDALLVNGSVNDRLYTSSALQTAMETYFADVAAIAPTLPIVVVGYEPIHLTDATTVPSSHITAQQAACDASPNVVGYIDPFTEDWFTGTGNDSVPNNTGNQDWLTRSDMHPNAKGCKLYAYLTAERMKPLKAGLA